MCTHPARANIFCHADSCLPSLPEVKQWYLPMVSFLSSRRTYCGHILSGESNQCEKEASKTWFVSKFGMVCSRNVLSGLFFHLIMFRKDPVF